MALGARGPPWRGTHRRNVWSKLNGSKVACALDPRFSGGEIERRKAPSRVAQLVEQVTVNHRVGGSSPSSGAPQNQSSRPNGNESRIMARCRRAFPVASYCLFLYPWDNTRITPESRAIERSHLRWGTNLQGGIVNKAKKGNVPRPDRQWRRRLRILGALVLLVSVAVVVLVLAVHPHGTDPFLQPGLRRGAFPHGARGRGAPAKRADSSGELAPGAEREVAELAVAHRKPMGPRRPEAHCASSTTSSRRSPPC
jgi:hypothetical protein